VVAKLIEKFKRNKLSDFYKSTISLSLTSFLSQFIIFVGTPLITRIYAPADFADVAILSSLIQCLGVFATLRYDNAIPLCDSDDESNVLFLICTVFNIFFSVALFLILFILQQSGVHIFNLKNANFIYFVPLGVSLYGFVNLLSFFATRTHQFNRIGVSRVLQSVTSIASTIGLGYSSVPILGPIIGYIFQIGFGVIYMSNIISRKLQLLFNGKYTRSDFEIVANKFIKFPKYSLLEAVMQMVSLQLPFFYLNLINDQAGAGFLMNAMKFSQIPIVLIAASISQVYYGHIKKNLDMGTLYPVAIDILVKLYKILILPLLLILPIAPFIFRTYLGKEWEHSGELMQWIIPYIIALIVYSIFSVNFYAKEKFVASLRIQGVVLIFRTVALLIGYFFFREFTLEIFFASSAFIYFIFWGYALKIIDIGAKDFFKILWESKKLSALALIIFLILLFIF